jgi:UDP-glucose 4-epimerase
MNGVDAVVHMAALLHITNPQSSLQPRYERINVEGTRLVVEAAQAAHAKRLLFFSTIAVYGANRGKILDETATPQPQTLYAQSKLAAETIVLQAKRDDGRPLGVVLRLGAVYGARVKGNYQRLVYALAKHRFIPIGEGNNRRTLVYDKDVAHATLLALEHSSAAGKVFNITDGQIHTVYTINRAICNALGRIPPRFYIPVGVVRVVANMLERMAHTTGHSRLISLETVDKYLEDIAVDGQRIQAELGFQPAYSLDTGWGETIREMRQQGKL